MVKLVLHKQSGFILWMKSDGFTKEFFITTESLEYPFTNGQGEPMFFDTVIEAVDAFNTCILDDNIDMKGGV